MPDRIVAGTYMLLLAATGGSDPALGSCRWSSLTSLWPVLGAMGVDVRTEGRTGIPRPAEKKALLSSQWRLRPIRVSRRICSRLCWRHWPDCPERAALRERVFEARFKIVEELRKMGADITLHGEDGTGFGERRCRERALAARELRGGAALCIAAAAAQWGKPHLPVPFYRQRLRKYNQGFARTWSCDTLDKTKT